MAIQTIISGTGLYIPPDSISNEELVSSFNHYVDDQNKQDTSIILQHSSAAFIEKASGILNRHVIDKTGILDPQRMRPALPLRAEEECSIQAEFACQAIQQALTQAQKSPEQVDGLIVSCVALQRSYPGIAVEIQKRMGFTGYAFDMMAACSSSTFGITTAVNAIANGQNNCIVVVNPELTSCHANFKDRDSHFIFGDACTALVLERTSENPPSETAFAILGCQLKTNFSNNIRNNFGFLNHTETNTGEKTPHYLFQQNGRKVFKEVVPMVETHIVAHLNQFSMTPSDLKRYWLHQANININDLIIRKILGRAPQALEAPIILDQLGNTASCGSLIAFHQYHSDLKAGDLGLICSFGAGYSIGSILVRKT